MPAPYEKGGRTVLWGPLLAAIVVGFALGGLGVFLFLRDHYNVTPLPPEAETPQTSAKPDKVVARGRIEPRDGIIPLGVPAPDRIRKLLVKESVIVKKDDRLAVLDSEGMRQLERKLAVIQLNQAGARLSAIRKNGEAQVHVAEVNKQISDLEPIELKMLPRKIKLLEAQEANAQENAKRYVAAGDTIAKQDVEKQDLALQQIRAELKDARSQLKKLQKTTDLNRSVAKAQLEAAKAESEQSQSAISLDLLDTQVQQADERLKEAKVLAPSDGKILRLFVHEGELVSGNPILEMANINHMIALAEVYESDIERVKRGQEATVTSDIGHIFQGKNALKGEVVEISGIVGKARVAPLDPLMAADRRVVEVKVALKPISDQQAEQIANLIGHQVLVEIDTAEGSR